MKKNLFFAAAMAVWAAAGDLPVATEWIGGDGWYNDPANWSNGMPANGKGGYGRVPRDDRDYVLRFPEGTFRENGGFYVSQGSGDEMRSVTLDFTGCKWIKTAAEVWENQYCVFGLAAYQSGNSFGTVMAPEGFGSATASDGKPVFEFENGKLTYRSSKTAAEVIFESGRYDFIKADGVDLPWRTLYFGNREAGSGGTKVRFLEGSEFRARATVVRNNGHPHLIFEGGTHHLGQATVGDGNTGWANYGTGTMEVRGGTVNAGNLGVGQVQRGRGTHVSTVVVTNGGTFNLNGSAQLGSLNGENNTAHVWVCGDGLLNMAQQSTGEDFKMGYATNSLAILEVSGRGRVELGRRIRMGLGGNATTQAKVLVRENGALNHKDDQPFICWGGVTGGLELRDNAAMTIKNILQMGGDAKGGAFTFTIADNAVLAAAGGIRVNSSAGEGAPQIDARLNFLGGRVKTGRIRGWDGVARGHAVFDGATVEATQAQEASNAQDALIGWLESATIGSGGLTVESGYSNAVKQAFADAAGAAPGAFVKRGSGELTALETSGHAWTRVEGGKLTVVEGVKKFGEKIELGDGTELTVRDGGFGAGEIAAGAGVRIDLSGGKITAGKFAVGGAGKFSVVKIGAEPVHVADAGELRLENVRVELADAETVGVRKVFTFGAGTMDAAAVAGMRVHNMADGRRYEFGVNGEDGSLELTTEEGTTEYNWVGGESGAWGEGGNWDSGAAPDYQTTAKLGATGARKALVVEGAQTAKKVEVEGAAYSLEGSGSLLAENGIAVRNGALEVKTAGLLADSPNGEAETRVEGAAFCYTAAGAQRTGAALALDSTGGERLPNTVRAEGDLTFGGGVRAAAKAYLAKTGKGTLTLEVPWSATAVKLTSGTEEVREGGAVRYGVNVPPSGTFEPGPLGTVTNWLGQSAGEVSVFDGVLRLKGTGEKRTKMTAYGYWVVGANYKGAEGDAVGVELENVEISTEASGRHTFMPLAVSREAATKKVRLAMTNALWHLDWMRFGYGAGTKPAGEVGIELALTNATLEATFRVTLPERWDYTNVTFAVGPGGVIRSGGTAFSQWASGKNLTVGEGVRGRVEDGGKIELPGGLFAAMNSQNMRGGEVEFNRGGRLTCGGIYNEYRMSKISFDGGVLEFVKSWRSHARYPERHLDGERGFEVKAGGIEIRCGEGVRHEVAFPMKGEGTMVKTGAGELVLLAGMKAEHDNGESLSQSKLVWKGEAYTGYDTAGFGGMVAAEGVLSVTNGGVRAGMPAEVRAGAALNLSGAGEDAPIALGVLTGEGVVSNGAFTAELAVSEGMAAGTEGCIELRDAKLAGGKTWVDFGGVDAMGHLREPMAVMRLGAGAAVDLAGWKGKNCGTGVTVEFGVDAEGVVRATLRTTGMCIIVK